ncbi:putative nicotinate-nucleotide pyrophosphorylase [mine drainage metagenome]|uniref:Putative pyrophosphorylase ModD n=1 Tax=mine drainage metagenome TaxID=410659 RepID=A0A1J5SUQ7_9ZZZZ
MNYLALTDEELAYLLYDDVPCGDLTTETLGIAQQTARLEFRARQEMVVCAIEEAARLFTLSGAKADAHVHSGQHAGKDELLLEAQGNAQILHRVWKTAQVLVEWASGISTASAAIVDAASTVAVACTRKNVPGTKALSVKAVRAGGATMHRLGLSESMLLFPEHRMYLDEMPAATVARIRRAEPERKLVVEVVTVEEAIVWAGAGAEVLQLEKFSPESVAECRGALDRLGLKLVLAVAGGIRADNAAAYVRAGADLLVTSAPYTAPPRDVQVRFFKVAP